MVALAVGFGVVAVGDVLGEVLGQVADTAVCVLAPGQDALCVEAVAEFGDVQGFVVISDGVERVVPSGQESARAA